MSSEQNVAPISSRHHNIDLLETLAIFLVIIYHSTAYSYDFLTQGSITHYVRYLLRALMSPCVGLFFLANGYLLFNRPFQLRRHILKTIRMIALTGIWGIVRILVLMPVRNEYFSVSEIVRTLLLWKHDWVHTLWFMGAIVCIYVVFPVLKHVFDTHIRLFGYFTVVCFLCSFGFVLIDHCESIFLTLTTGSDLELSTLDFFSIFNPFRGIRSYAFVYFCLGGLLCRSRERILAYRAWKRNILAIGCMVVSTLGLWGMAVYFSHAFGKVWDIVWDGYDTVFTLINVICIYILCLNFHRPVTLVRVISSSTLGIYFIHDIFIQLTRDRIFSFDLLRNLPCNVLYAVAILLVSLVVTLALRKIPHVKKLLG